jgi:hypothetical protein
MTACGVLNMGHGKKFQRIQITFRSNGEALSLSQNKNPQNVIKMKTTFRSNGEALSLSENKTLHKTPKM